MLDDILENFLTGARVIRVTMEVSNWVSLKRSQLIMLIGLILIFISSVKIILKKTWVTTYIIIILTLSIRPTSSPGSPSSARTARPSSPLIGSPVSSSILITYIGRMKGNRTETNPTAPTLRRNI